MGMGEPLMNLDAVLAACERLPDLGITHRRTAISTVGWIPGIDAPRPPSRPAVRLALSLHAAEDALRSRAHAGQRPLSARRRARRCERFYARQRRRVFVEYVMLAGVNDRYEQARRARRACSTARIFKVNLIPYNPTGGAYAGLARASAIAAFRAALEEHGLRATVRLTRGRDIDAACGQLAAKA